MSAWHERPLADLRRALDTGETTAVALADHFLGRIATSTLNAFIDVRPDATLEAARSADERLARGERAPLLGVPIAHKDVFVTRGWRSTAGSRMLADYVSPFDATVVERLAAQPRARRVLLDARRRCSSGRRGGRGGGARRRRSPTAAAREARA
jgi:Asp-tRNA(Asn)/Glu-tRNA(Gln) amidotransferase A subunit family amidase